MPTTIGVRELKNQTYRIVRAVREEMAEYVITVQVLSVSLSGLEQANSLFYSTPTKE